VGIVGAVEPQRKGGSDSELLVNGDLPLEYRLRRLHRRRRRAVIHRVVTGAFWSAGLLAAAAFAIGVSIEVAQR
jgi:hypothetical protein